LKHARGLRMPLKNPTFLSVSGILDHISYLDCE
jgi:hypothetical protein